jgi:hypothetical protein
MVKSLKQKFIETDYKQTQAFQFNEKMQHHNSNKGSHAIDKTSMPV